MNDAQLLMKLAGADAFQEGAPLPESIWTSDLALREIERRTIMQMQTLKPTSTESPERRPQGWMIVVAAFGAVIILGFAVMLSNGGETIEPAATPVATAPLTTAASSTTATPATTVPSEYSTAVAQLEGWAAALSAGDAVAAIAYLHEGEEGTVDVLKFFAGYADDQRVEDCRDASTGSQTLIDCTLIIDEPIMNELGLSTLRMRAEHRDGGLIFRDFGNRLTALQDFSAYAEAYESEAFDAVCNPDTVEGSSWLAAGHILSYPCGLVYAELAQDVADWIAADRPMP